MAHENTAPSTSLPDGPVAFLGTGNMSGAILRGLLAAGTAPAGVRATVRTPEKAAVLAAETGVAASATGEDPEANRRAAAGAAVVVLGVKPVGIADLCREIAPALEPGAVVVSVAAGVTLATMEAALPAGQPVVRTMPNTPLMVGRGVVGIAAGAAATAAHASAVRALFEPSGLVADVEEAQLDALGAISGSGPAYVFYLAEALAAAGEELGLDAELARRLARGTVAGAGEMLAAPDADPATLRRNVTSPNGTTERALAVFDAEGLPGIVARGARAAAERSAALGRELAG